MFSQEDYKQYFEILEQKLVSLLTIYTGLLNDIDNKAIRSKINSLTAENLDTYRFIKEQKQIFFKEAQ